MDQNFSSVVRQAAGRTAPRAPRNVGHHLLASYDRDSRKQVVDEFLTGGIPAATWTSIYAETHQDRCPRSQKQSQAARAAAPRRNLDQAKLDLSYCTVVAEIDGVVTRRNVNPGN